jgi:hypothetical protein
VSGRVQRLCAGVLVILTLEACQSLTQPAPNQGDAAHADDARSVAATPSDAKSADGKIIAWKEHLVDDESTNGGLALRGGDGLITADIDKDGFVDIVSVHEDSHHLRIAFGSARPDVWVNITLASGAAVAAIEDVAVGDINGDGWPDLVAACEEAHLLYLQNPGAGARKEPWPQLIPAITQGRGSWLRVFIADMDQDGHPDVLGANKGAVDIVDPSLPITLRPTSLFLIDGDPLEQANWREQVLSREAVPNTAMPVDIDDDGDLDVLVAGRLSQQMTLLEVTGFRQTGGVDVRPHPIRIEAGFPVPGQWQGTSSAFQSVFADLDGDGRKDLIVAVHESPQALRASPLMASLGWLKQPSRLDDPWLYYRIGDILPDVVIGIALADLNGNGHLDAVVGGYSGLNIIAGSYSGASREVDDPRVSAASTVGRMAWFENSGDPRSSWKRHDISRRVRGMYDAFVPRDMDGDGDIDLIATRGNSGDLDGVFWLEQIRADAPQPALTLARKVDSRALPLPPLDWADRYQEEVRFIAPNRVAPTPRERKP